MKPGLALSFGYDDGSLHALTSPRVEPEVLLRDIYSLPEIDLDDFSVLFVSMHSDQRFLTLLLARWKTHRSAKTSAPSDHDGTGR